jgi:hypothetical protein
LGSRVLEALESRDALPPPTARLLREHRVAIQRIALQGDQALLERLFRLAAADVSAVSKPVFESLLRLIGVRPFEALRPEMVRRHLWQAALEESVHATAADPQTRLRSLLRAALEASARSASMSYRELLSQLHERLQAAASRTARAIPADIREPLLTALPREGVAEGKTPSDDLRFTREGPSAQTVGDRDEVASSHEGNEKGDASPTRRKRERAATSPPDHPGESAMPTERDILVEAKTRREAVVSEGDVIFVDDAGIALLHPFLAAHFEKLGLQRDGAFLDDDTRERAVHQVRFLATGEEQSPEPLLVFAKIMCGLTPGVPIARSAPLGEYAKTEANALLQAVIRHWGALKNATPDGLRETFLRREGRLERKDDGWKLRVESRSYDLLLDRLPWSLSVVRLPWMADVLFVEWG